MPEKFLLLLLNASKYLESVQGIDIRKRQLNISLSRQSRELFWVDLSAK